MKKRQEVFDNLPVDISPLYWNHRPRRRSSDVSNKNDGEVVKNE